MSRVVLINGPAIGVAPRSEAGSTLNGAAGSTGKPARRSVFPGKPCKDAVPVRSAIARSRRRKEPVTDTVMRYLHRLFGTNRNLRTVPEVIRPGIWKPTRRTPLFHRFTSLLVGYIDGPNVGERHVDPAT
jgi:hypothetical protein